MSTKDEIMNIHPPKGSAQLYNDSTQDQEQGDTGQVNPPVGSKQWYDTLSQGQQQDEQSNVSYKPSEIKTPVTQPQLVNNKIQAPVTTEHKTTAQLLKDKISGNGSPADGEPLRLSYVDMLNLLGPKRQTKEEEEKQKKKEKRDKIFAAIGDGVSAFSNLFATIHGAPNAYKRDTKTMSEATKARYDKLNEERDKNNLAYYNAYINALKADDAKANAERNWQHKLGIDNAKSERDIALFNLKVQLENHKITAAEADAQKKAIEAKYADGLAKAKEDTEKARAKTEEAKAKYYGNRETGSGGTPGEYPWYDKDGNINYAHSYEAMRQNAINNGTWNDLTETSTREVKIGGQTTDTAETTRPGKGYSSKPEINNDDGSGKDVNPMGDKSNNNGKRPNPMS